MTDRTHSLTVALERDMRVDDIEELVAAISLLRHVIKVKANVVDIGDFVSDSRARFELTQKLWKVLEEKA